MSVDLSNAYAEYVRELRQTPLDQHTEHTGRAALQRLLERARDAFALKGTVVQHEPRRHEDKGAPDFKISRAGAILGYVENKAVDTPLAPVLKSKQIKNYQELSSNLLVTDYLKFVWLNGDGKSEARLGDCSLLEGKVPTLNPDKMAEVTALLQGFYSQAEVGISKSKSLAEALAVRAHLLRDFLEEELVRQHDQHQSGKLYGLFLVFKEQVSQEITLGEFADAFAQTLAYGLFLARLNTDGGTSITLLNAKTHIPRSVGVIRELVGFIDELDQQDYTDVKWVVEEVVSIINGINLSAIQEDLAFRNRSAPRSARARNEEEWRLFSRDPFVYFYEDFLAKYDKKLREKRGVYYTPPPIVNFIVRAVDDILKNDFTVSDGLADRSKVTVLDFACGTGTFLVEVLERIFSNIGGEKSAKAAGYVHEHMLKNIYGFEYLIAPYTIAHLKLSQFLSDKGYAIGDEERFQVYLTNTLEAIDPQPNYLLPALSGETELAQGVKEKPVLVITGNPPYAGHSKNPSSHLIPFESLTEDAKRGRKFKVVTVKTPAGKVKMAKVFTDIGAQIEKYKAGPVAVEKPLQPKWLQNDYVKFLRFAQSKMDQVEEGIVAVITANSFLDGQTFARMRYSLLQTFNRAYVIDLHGSTDRLERTPEGDVDQNVFDISTGVCISIFVRKPGLSRGVFHTDWWGKRQLKYELASSQSLSDLDFKVLEPQAPKVLFVPQSTPKGSEFEKWHSVSDIFSRNGKAAPGLVTLHDDFAVSFTKGEAVAKARALMSSKDLDEARTKFALCKTDQWDFESAKRTLGELDLEGAAKQITYRPFDARWTIWDRSVAVHLRLRASGHLLKPNRALLTSRATKGETFAHALVTDKPAEAISLSSKTSNNAFVFPLYVYKPEEEEKDSADTAPPDRLFADDDPFNGADRMENISPTFRRWIDGRLGRTYSPEEIFNYIYAVLHAPSYRARYADALRTSFPRVPFPETAEVFDSLAELGEELVEAHLMHPTPKRGLAAHMEQGSNVVEYVEWAPDGEKLWINRGQGFSKVPERVWNFAIGGYKVLDKFLKGRKGRCLSLDEIEQVERICNVVDFTVHQMELIDPIFAGEFPG